MKRLVVLVVSAVVAVMLQVDCAMAETKRPEGMVTPVKEDQTIKGQGVDASFNGTGIVKPERLRHGMVLWRQIWPFQSFFPPSGREDPR